MKIEIILILISINLKRYLTSRAPDKAPILPEGWCNKQYGTPTKSTGECICKYKCQGNKCRNEQGIKWYEYKECPTCQCVGINEETLTSNSNNNKKEEEIKNKIDSKRNEEETNRNIEQENENNVIDDSYDRSILDILEENSKLIFAVIVTVIVFSLVICGLFIPTQK